MYSRHTALILYYNIILYILYNTAHRMLVGFVSFPCVEYMGFDIVSVAMTTSSSSSAFVIRSEKKKCGLRTKLILSLCLVIFYILYSAAAPRCASRRRSPSLAMLARQEEYG